VSPYLLLRRSRATLPPGAAAFTAETLRSPHPGQGPLSPAEPRAEIAKKKKKHRKQNFNNRSRCRSRRS